VTVPSTPLMEQGNACRLERNPRRVGISRHERRVRQRGLGVPGNRRGMHSDLYDELEALPEDIDDPEKYIVMPTPRDLDLGTRLVMRFAAERLSDRTDEISAIFSRKGAYGVVTLSN
jgi:hypothetical protein